MVAAERNDAIAGQLAPFAMHPSFIHCSDTKKDAIDLTAATLAKHPQAERDAFVASLELNDYSGYSDPAAAKEHLIRRMKTAIDRRLPKATNSRPPAMRDADENSRLVRTEVSYGAPEEWWWIKRQGIAVQNHSNGPLLAAAKALNDTIEPFKSGEEPGARRALVAAAGRVDLLRLSHPTADQPVIDYADDTLCRALLALLDADNMTVTTDELALARKVALLSLDNPNPMGGADAEATFENSPSWSSPAPRAEAAALLITLAGHAEPLDDEVRKRFDVALADGNPIVRHHFAIRLNRLWDLDRGLLWSLLLKVAEAEPSRCVLKFFLNYPLARLTRAAPEKIEEFVAIIWDRFRADPAKPAIELRNEIADLTAVLGLYENITPSLHRMETWLGDVHTYRSELMHVVQTLRDGLTLGLADAATERNAIRNRCAEFLHKVVAATAAVLDSFYADHRTANDKQAEQARSAAQLLDCACMQLMFAIKPRHGPTVHDRVAPEKAVAEKFAEEYKATLQRIAEVGTPSTVHHLLDLLEPFLDAAPLTAFDLTATALLVAGQLHGYANDTLALDQFVRLMGRFLADHRALFQDASRRDRLIAMVDCFMDAGWPEARKLLNTLPDLLR